MIESMNTKIYSILLLCLLALVGCKNDDVEDPGAPTLEVTMAGDDFHFGDSIPFSAHVDDPRVPLSTVQAHLFYGDTKVSSTVIRTKESGKSYTGKVYAPYVADIPDGDVTIKFVLQNIHFTTTELDRTIAIARPDFPYLTFVSSGEEYKMAREDLYSYSVEAEFPQKVSGYIVAPALGENGNQITFGWDGESFKAGSTETVTFSNLIPGRYSVFFNTKSLVGGPFAEVLVSGKSMQADSSGRLFIDLDVTAGDKLSLERLPNVEKYWIDPTYFSLQDQALTVGDYSTRIRVILDLDREYITAEVLDGDQPASLKSDGTGAIWIIGDGVGKPSYKTNQVSWNTDKAMSLVPLGDNKFGIILTAGETINPDDINFKFFHQKGWGGEFKHTTLTTTSDLIFVGDGSNGRDSGNLGLKEGAHLEEGASYLFVVDLSEGQDNAVLTVEKI